MGFPATHKNALKLLFFKNFPDRHSLVLLANGAKLNLHVQWQYASGFKDARDKTCDADVAFAVLLGKLSESAWLAAIGNWIVRAALSVRRGMPERQEAALESMPSWHCAH